MEVGAYIRIRERGKEKCRNGSSGEWNGTIKNGGSAASRRHRGITKLNIITKDLELETNIHTFHMSHPLSVSLASYICICVFWCECAEEARDKNSRFAKWAAKRF